MILLSELFMSALSDHDNYSEELLADGGRASTTARAERSLNETLSSNGFR